MIRAARTRWRRRDGVRRPPRSCGEPRRRRRGRRRARARGAALRTRGRARARRARRRGTAHAGDRARPSRAATRRRRGRSRRRAPPPARARPAPRAPSAMPGCGRGAATPKARAKRSNVASPTPTPPRATGRWSCGRASAACWSPAAVFMKRWRSWRPLVSGGGAAGPGSAAAHAVSLEAAVLAHAYLGQPEPARKSWRRWPPCRLSATGGALIGCVARPARRARAGRARRLSTRVRAGVARR